MTPIEVRDAGAADADALAELLNEIVAIGGTTAIEEPLSASELVDWCIARPNLISCLAAERDGVVIGFQWLARNETPPTDWGVIATFARVRPKTPGVGRALFSATRQRAVAAGLVAIDATIRADNVGGLAFYAKMGFEDHSVARAIPLADGTPVDRVSKVYWL